MAKILNKEEFLRLPNNTLYAEYMPCVIGDIYIKGDTIGENADFYHQPITQTETEDSYEMVKMLESGLVKFDLDCEQREAEYNKDSLYLVYEKEDVEQLINRLQMCLS